MRVIIAGSRTWDAYYKIHSVLNELAFLADILGTGLTVKHGACPTGADAIADAWITDHQALQVKVERFPADWRKLGKRAGMIRNADMVDSGADMVVAFLRDGSTGTSNTIQLARTAGIPTFVINYDENHLSEAQSDV